MNEASSANVSSNRTSVNFYFAFDVEVELDIWDGHQVVIPIDFGRHQYSFSSSLQEKGKRIMKKCIWIFRNLFMVVMVFISVLPAWFEWYLMHLIHNADYALYRGSVRINCIQRYQELSPRLHVVSYAIVQYLMPILLLLIVMCCLYLEKSPVRLAVWVSAVLVTILLFVLCLTWVPCYPMYGKMRYMSFLGLLSRYTVPYSIRRGGIGGAQLVLLFTPIITILYRGFKRRKK